VPSAVTARGRTSSAKGAAPAATALEPTFAEQVCLALVAEGTTHGWAVGGVLAPDGDLGRIWTLSRPLTYRAVDGLADKGLIARRAARAGQGHDRVVLTVTAAGRRASRHWLDEPVAHLRDVRTELLVKLELRARAGLDAEPLLAAQQHAFAPMIAALSLDRPEDRDDLVSLWRRESARAVRRFLAGALHPPSSAANKDRPNVRLSARNQLRASITAVKHGEVMSTVRVVLPDGQELTAAITKDAAEDLDLAAGDDVVVVVKSTEVMIAKE
jgi:PadR family transcriptional regulator AphA